MTDVGAVGEGFHVARRECPGCALEVEPSTAGCCPVCGYEFPRRSPLKIGVTLVLVAAILVPVLLAVWHAVNRR